MPKSAKGFTLVELLVVIAIIAVLSTIGVVIFGNIQSQARDARRKGDIDTIAKAMEVGYGQCQGKYCNINTTFFASGTIPRDPLEQNDGTTPNQCGYVTNPSSPTPCRYCFLSPNAPAYLNAPPWNAAHGGCGDFNSLAVAGSDGSYWYNEPQINGPGGAGNYISKFLICANLENPDNGKNYYCRSNQQ